MMMAVVKGTAHHGLATPVGFVRVAPPVVGSTTGCSYLQVPLSVQTFWLLAPGMSPWVHHLAIQL